ncbi:phosphate ABC transporter permease PstA, partial [Vibrio diabolicus]
MDRAKLKQARQFKDNVFNALVWISAALTVGFLF